MGTASMNPAAARHCGAQRNPAIAIFVISYVWLIRPGRSVSTLAGMGISSKRMAGNFHCDYK
jgi:hypothetical protein